jgi:hypothetical protein
MQLTAPAPDSVNHVWEEMTPPGLLCSPYFWAGNMLSIAVWAALFTGLFG